MGREIMIFFDDHVDEPPIMPESRLFDILNDNDIWNQ